MKKRILAMLLCLSMAMQMTSYVGAGDEYIEDVPLFDVIEDGEIIQMYDEYPDEDEEIIMEDDLIIGEVEDDAEAEPEWDNWDDIDDIEAEEIPEGEAEEEIFEEITEDDVILGEEIVEEEVYEEVVEEVFELESVSMEAETFFATDSSSKLVGDFVDFSISGKNSIMLIPGTAEPLEDILEAIDPEIYGKYKKENVTSVTVSPEDCGITCNASSYAITASTEFGYDEATLTVEMTDKTYSIRVLRGEAIFALEGADANWNKAATTTKTAEAFETNKTQEVKAFNSTIYADSDYDQDNDDVLFGSNYKIYMRPGMAVTISKGISLFDIDSEKQFTEFTNDGMTMYEEFASFTWMYDGSKYNYIIAHDVAEYTVARFYIKNHTLDDAPVRTIELHIIPDNIPVLLREYLEEHPVEGYSIKEVPATLFDYDGQEWNNYYSKLYTDQKYYAFTSADGDKSTDTSTYGYDEKADQANTGSRNANQGLVKPKLKDGLPVMAQKNPVDLFSTTPIANAKEVYSNVGFEFIYDSDGYYNYNSELNHAQYKEYDDGTRKIELYTQSLSASDSNNITLNWADQNAKAGFYPFADINEAFISKDATSKSVKEKLDRLNIGVDDNNRLNGDLAKDFVSTSKKGSTVDMYFGVHLHSSFYLPKDKKLNGNEMIYEFTGDDDLWVFIDGQLVLDVGGGHTPVSGSFNLTTGEVWVEKFYQLGEEDGGYYAEKKAFLEGAKYRIMVKNENGEEYDFLKTLEGDQMHTISIFYLERFSGESNCRMRFNLPLVPVDSVNVSKEVLNYKTWDSSFAIVPDVDYTFTLYTAADNDDFINATLSPAQNISYTVTGSSDVFTTGENGQFKLKAGQTASFINIPRFTEVYIVENNPDNQYTYSKATVSVNKGNSVDYTYNSPTETKVMQLNTPMYFDFVNYIDTADLTIAKTVSGTGGDDFKKTDFEFTLMINGGTSYTDDNITSSNGIFELKHEESIKIENIPVGMSYSVVETEFTAYEANRYKLDTKYLYNGTESVSDSYYIQSGDNNNIVVENIFTLLLANLKIDKVITDTDFDPNQTFVFIINGEEEATSEVQDMRVVIQGDGEILITDLPVGLYTVEEDKNWCGRYHPSDKDYDQEANVQVVPEGEDPTTVIFTNMSTTTQWLDSNAYAQNIFKKKAD